MGNKETALLVSKTKPIKFVWIMSGFNWITIVDLKLSELQDCVLLITCLESMTSPKLSQHCVRSARPNQLLIPVLQHRCSVVLGQLFVFCPLISVVESLLSAPLMISSLLPTGCVANFGVSSVRA